MALLFAALLDLIPLAIKLRDACKTHFNTLGSEEENPVQNKGEIHARVDDPRVATAHFTVLKPKNPPIKDLQLHKTPRLTDL